MGDATKSSPGYALGADAAAAPLPAFARTADVIEEVAEWAGVHPAETLMGMRGVSHVWRGAVSSALRRMAAHEDEGWASASRVSAYVAAKPVVVRLCIVAGGGEWLRELPDGAVGPLTRQPGSRPPQPTAELDTVSPSASGAIDVLRRVPLLERMPAVTLHSAADAAALFSVLSTRCPRLQNLALRLASPVGPGILTVPVLALLPRGIESLELQPAAHHSASKIAPLDILVPRLAPTLRDVVLDWGDPGVGVFELLVCHCGPQLRRCNIVRHRLAPVVPPPACSGLVEMVLQQVGDDAARTLAARCPLLESLSLVDAKMTAAGLLAIADGCKRLSELRLHRDDSGYAVARTTWRSWADFARRCPTLRIFAVDDMKSAVDDSDALAAFARALPALEALSLARTASAFGAGALCRFAAQAPGLRYLTLGEKCTVTDAVLHALGSGCPQLRELETTDAGVTDEGLEALARGCPELRVLGLSVNTGDRFTRRPTAPTATFSDRGVAAVARGCKALAEVKLDGRASLTDATLHALVAHARRLHRITYPMRCKMTVAGLEQLAAAGVCVTSGRCQHSRL